MTGWYTDGNGDTYYLNPVSDNTLGRMVTGWYLIDGVYYYFNEEPEEKCTGIPGHRTDIWWMKMGNW